MTTSGNSRNDKSSKVSLDSLQKELIEARNQAIKTDNLVKNLSADIKLIAKAQDGYHRKYLFNSAVAYVVFSVLIFTGLFMVFRTQTKAYEDEVEHYRIRNEQLQDELDVAQTDLDRRRRSEDQAYAFFELIQSGRSDEVVEQFPQVQSELTDRAMVELLRDRVAEINYTLADEAYREGLGHVNAERWSDARDAFLDSLNHIERTPWAPELHLNLGLALYSLEDFEGALHYLDQGLASQELDEAHAAKARFHRGLCLESTGRLGEAIDAFRAFREHHETHRLSGRALYYINRIQRVIDRNAEE